MYCDFYGFSEKPFDLTPDPNFLYLGAKYRELLASLVYGIRERRGIVALVGEAGTGKTTLLNAVQDRMDQNTQVAFIVNTDMSFEQLLQMVVLELGIVKSGEKLSKVDALNRLNHLAIRQRFEGGRVVLIVDEAQNLDTRTLENLRLLSNLETRKHKLIQIILAGQPELDVKLNRPELHQLVQRISLKRYIQPLNEKETDDYIEARLSLANYQGGSLFSRDAKHAIWERSGGIPRKINILCDNALLIGYAEGKMKIEKQVIAEAVKDLSWSPLRPKVDSSQRSGGSKDPKRVRFISFSPWSALALALAVLAFLVVWSAFFKKDSPTSPREVSNVASYKVNGGKDTKKASGTDALEAPIQAYAATAGDSDTSETPTDKTAAELPSRDLQTEINSKATDPLEASGPPSSAMAQDKPSPGGSPPVPDQVTAPKALSPKPGDLVIQVAAYRERPEAEDEMKTLMACGYEAYVKEKAREGPGGFYRVRVFGYKNFAEAVSALERLRQEGYKDCFLARHQ